jgi:Fe-S cluster assembly protein SufD
MTLSAHLEKVLAQGFPIQRHEQWKYTNVSAIAARADTLRAAIASKEGRTTRNYGVSPDIAADIKTFSTNYIIYINGCLSSSAFNREDQDNIEIKPLSSNDPGGEDLSVDIFENLNHAFFENGLTVNIKKTLHQPLQIIYLNTEENWVQPRHHVCIESHANAIIIEDFSSTASSVMNIITNIQVQENAHLTYIKIQQEHETAFHIGRAFIQLHKNARAKTFTFSQGSQLARSDIHVKLTGEGAQSALYGLYISKNRMHLDHHTLIEHSGINTKSEEVYHGILQDYSRAVFNGKVIVHPDAVQTEAVQKNHNLLLSSDAEIDTKPELEIYCDNIRCSHGATIGQLDEKALFYLRARGLEESAAKKILISAFSNKILAYIPEKILQEFVRDKIHA